MFDLLKNKKVTDITTVPENLRPLYKDAGNGEHVLREDDPGIVASVTVINGLTGALTAARKEANDNKARAVDLSPLAEFGTDPKSIADKITAELAQARKAAGADSAQVIESLRKEVTTLRALEPKAKQVEAMEAHLKRATLLTAVSRATAKIGGDPDIIMPLIRDMVDVQVVDGKPVEIVKDPTTGERRISVANIGEHMGIAEFVETLPSVEKFKTLFPSKAKTGGGADTNRNHATAGADGTNKLSADQKIAAGVAKLTGKR